MITTAIPVLVGTQISDFQDIKNGKGAKSFWKKSKIEQFDYLVELVMVVFSFVIMIYIGVALKKRMAEFE